MNHEGLALTEGESFLGLSTLEVAREIVPANPAIRYVYLRPYFYIPDVPSGSQDVPFPLTRDDFLNGDAVEKVIESLDEGWNLALDSRVDLESGDVAHFPMIDLAPRKSSSALRAVKKRLAEIVVPHFGGGVILETRKSYQFLGTNLFDERRFQEFCGRAQLTGIVILTPDDKPNRHRMIADYRYISHSLIRGTTGLRISANGSKTVMPRVVDFI